MAKVEIYVDNNDNVQIPIVVEDVRYTTHRIGSPSKLIFKVLRDDSANFVEGNAVKLTVDRYNMFFGFIFSKRRDKSHVIEVTAYDQIRYLKNKDNFVYTNKTASDVIRMVANNFELQLGDISTTSYLIPQREDSDTTGIDAIYNALNLDLTNTGNLYVFFDDFGQLMLKPIEAMRIDLMIDESTGENFDYTTSIGESTYNRIKLVYPNPDTGQNDVYVVQDGNSINRWGVLQYLGRLQGGENGMIKAHAILDLFNAKTRRLRIKNAFGDVRIRAGIMPIIKLHLGDMILQNYMMVDTCTHIFRESEHFMDLTLRGGEFIG